MQNVTVQDLFGGTLATLVFAAVLYAPGYVLGYAVDLFHFRHKSWIERAAWAVLLSFAAVPIAMYFIGRAAGLTAVLWALAALNISFVTLHVRRRQLPVALGRTAGLVAGAATMWTLFVLLSLVDFQVGHRLYVSVVEFDQSYRVAFTDAVLHAGVPPTNPLYFAGHAAPMRYYYSWYVVCASVARLAGVTSRQALLASSVWVGFGLVAAIALWVRVVHCAGPQARRQTWIAVALLAVTGADLVPAIGSIFAQPALNGEMEWWSIDQFYSWQDSILWVPHHTAALLCCLTAFLLLRHTRGVGSLRQQVLPVVLAATALASSFGLSVYVAAGFALLILGWLVWLLPRWRENMALCIRIVLCGILSLAILTPFLHDLLATPSTQQGGGQAHAAGLLRLSVRRMIDPELVTHLPLFAPIAAAHPVLLDTVVRLLLLLPGLALELGVYGAIYLALLLHRFRAKDDRDTTHDTLLWLTGWGLLMVLFVRSSVISNNDFAYRASMLPQFLLLTLAADLLASWWPSGQATPRIAATPTRRRIVVALLALGLAGTIYQALMLRFFMPLEERIPESGFRGLAAAIFDGRHALETLGTVASADAVVAFNPVDPRPTGRGDVVTPFTFFSRSLLMNAHRQILSAEKPCASEFGGNAAPCEAIERQTSLLFQSAAVGPAQARDLCAHLGVTYLVATSQDPAWSGRQDWVSTLPVVAAEPALRILNCGPGPLQGDTATIPPK